MKINNFRYKNDTSMRRLIFIWGLAAITIGLIASCTKYENPPALYEEIKDQTTLQRKVLVVSIDGLSGAVLEAVAPEVIASLLPHSKYSYSTLSTMSNAEGWVSMLSGTGFSKHGINDESFEKLEDHDSENHGDIESFRNVLDYVTQYKPVTTALVTPRENLRNYVKNADFAPVVNNDLAVKDSTIALLSKVNNLGTVIVNFKDVELSGGAGGYSLSNPLYKDALLKSDAYLGDILKGIKARKNYEKEDWLIIVTTSHGATDLGAQKGFVIVYNPAFKKFELTKSGYNSVQFNPSSVNGTVRGDNGLYDGGIDKDFTVQMDVKFNVNTRYPGFLSKSTDMLGSNITGWLWMQGTDGNWAAVFGGTQNGGSGKNQITSGSSLIDGGWHTLTMGVKTNGSPVPTSRTVTLYVDGMMKASGSILGNKSLSVAEGLRVGYRNVDNGGTGMDIYAANLAYFNIALSESTVKNTFGLKDMKQHPNYTNLIGFWPMDEGAGGNLQNTMRGDYVMKLSGPYLWKSLGAFYPPGTLPIPIDTDISIVSTADDVAALTLYWMKIGILPEFKYDGKAYLKEFELEFLKD